MPYSIKTRAAIIMPAQHLRDGAGAAAVFRQQAAALQAAGWPIDAFVVAPRLRPWRQPAAADRMALEAAAVRLGADTAHVVDACSYVRLLPALQLATARIRERWNMASDFAAARLLDMTDLTCGRTHGLVICNYLSGISVADTLAPQDRQVLVLHDVPDGAITPAIRHVLRSRRIICLTSADAAALAAQNVDADILVGLPMAPADGAAPPEPASPPFDLLFVGGTHPPNMAGLAAFVRDCFTPYLADQGLSLAVAGAVGPALWPGNAPRGVQVLGRVDNLSAVYARSRLVVVPLLSGTGVSIKTLEALAASRPVLSSPIGLRGLVRDTAKRTLALALPPPFDRRWANRIEQLLADHVARGELLTGFVTALPNRTLTDVLVAESNAARASLCAGLNRAAPSVKSRDESCHGSAPAALHACRVGD